MMRCVAVAAALAGAGAAHAQTLTLSEARTLPADDIARRVLGAAGSLYREVERPGPHAGISLPGGPRLGLTSLSFATEPRSAGFAGLCEAEIAFVSFRPVRPPSEADDDPPARVAGLWTSRRYSIVGDAERGREEDWTSRRERRLDRLCNRAGPVFATGERRRFFGGEAFGNADLMPSHVSFAARALQQAISLAAAGVIRPTCTPHRSFSAEELCGDPARRLSRVSPSAVSRVVLDRCSAATADVCVTVSFTMPDQTPWSARIVEVRIHTDSAAVDPPPTPLVVRQVSLSGTHLVV